MKYIVLIGLMSILSTESLAYGVVNGKIIEVRIDQSGLAMVKFDQPVTGSYATCRISAYTNWLSFNTNTAAGRSIMAMVLTAKTTGSTVAAYGLGTCSNFGGYVEDWDYGVAL